MLSMFKKKAAEAVNKYQGNTDFLEAVCAACALTAASSGGISEAEAETTAKTVVNHSTISAAFDSRTIQETIARMLDRAESGGRSGRLALMKEIDDVAEKGDKELNEAILLAAWDIAESGETAEEREVDEAEHKTLTNIATRLGLKMSDYENV